MLFIHHQPFKDYQEFQTLVLHEDSINFIVTSLKSLLSNILVKCCETLNAIIINTYKKILQFFSYNKD